MRVIRPIIFMVLFATANAEDLVVTVLASLDSERIAATGMKTEQKSDMPDFAITYILGPETTDSIGIYEGGHPSPFSTPGKNKRLGEVKDTIAGQSVIWVCWSEEAEGKTHFGAETIMPSRQTLAILAGGKKEVFMERFHIFIMRGDLKSLAVARKLAASFIKKGPNQGSQQSARLMRD